MFTFYCFYMFLKLKSFLKSKKKKKKAKKKNLYVFNIFSQSFRYFDAHFPQFFLFI